MIKKVFITIALCSTLIAQAKKIIVWDLGFTLVKTDQTAIAGEIGWGTVFGNLVRGTGSQSYLRNTMYAILLNGSGCQQINDPRFFVRDENGVVLPLVMSDHWLTNKLSPAEILEITDAYVDAWDAQNKFHHKSEKTMIKGILRTIFSPDIVAKHTHLITKAVTLVEECKRAGCTQYILSNWERESFEQLYKNKKNKKLFSLIPRKNIIISGDCGMVKPNKNIFTYFIEKYNLNPAECIFVDDQEENVLGARACGLCSLQLKNGDYKTLEKELIALDAL